MAALNSFITVTRRGSGEDALGQPNGTWATFVQTWGEIRHMTGLERIRSGVEASELKASIRVRAGLGITHLDRVTFRSITYDVEAVLPDELDRKYCYLVCKVIQ